MLLPETIKVYSSNVDGIGGYATALNKPEQKNYDGLTSICGI